MLTEDGKSLDRVAILLYAIFKGLEVPGVVNFRNREEQVQQQIEVLVLVGRKEVNELRDDLALIRRPVQPRDQHAIAKAGIKKGAEIVLVPKR